MGDFKKKNHINIFNILFFYIVPSEFFYFKNFTSMNLIEEF